MLIHMRTGVESETVIAAMRAPRAEGALGLRMPDGIIRPASADARACELLREAGERVAGVELRLQVDRPPPQGREPEGSAFA